MCLPKIMKPQAMTLCTRPHKEPLPNPSLFTRVHGRVIVPVLPGRLVFINHPFDTVIRLKCYPPLLAVMQDKQKVVERALKEEKERSIRDEEFRVLQQRLRQNRSRSPTPSPSRCAVVLHARPRSGANLSTNSEATYLSFALSQRGLAPLSHFYTCAVTHPAFLLLSSSSHAPTNAPL